MSGLAARKGAAAGRSEVFGTLLAVALLNSLAPRISASIESGWGMAIGSLLGVSAAIWLAFYALLKLSLGDESRTALSGADAYVAAGTVAALLIPLPLVSAAALFGCGTYLIFSARQGSPLRRTAIVAVAATGPLLWGPACQALFGPEISRLETVIIGGLTGLSSSGNVIRSADGTTTFIVARGCSALANISLSVLLLVVVVQLLGLRFSRRLQWTAIAAILGTVFVNSVRLGTLGFYPQTFSFVHEGAGRELFAWCGLLLTGGMIAFGVSREIRSTG